MDTLADLASMQNHQPVRSTPPLNSHNSSDSLAALHRPSLTAHPRASFDIAMVETPRQQLRSEYTGTSLPLEKQTILAHLVEQVQETPSAYEAHIEIIKILHQGFVDHIYPSSSPNARRDPNSYDLLPELRQARESADKIFALGEEQWLDWLQDESILAQSADERVGVVEKCRRAIEEEHASSQLWSTYGDWVLHCYNWANDSQPTAAQALPDEERLIGKELFPWDNVLQTWDQAFNQTKLDISQSQIVWDKYLRLRFPSFEDKLPDESAAKVLEFFQQRLQSPHAQWENTFQTFSSFVSANFSNEAYEEIMATTNQASSMAKTIWSAREPFESAIIESVKLGDKYAEYQAYVSYIQWEKAQLEQVSKRKPKGQRPDQVDAAQSLAMISALFERAELRIPSVVDIWQEHAAFVSQNRLTGLLDVYARASKHCPWSGALWKQYLLAAELADEPFQDVENIKHEATKTGMLDAGGIEEVLKVHDAWCGYLLRRAKKVDSIEEDADVAEMGIRTSIEAVQTSASKMGLPANFDASFRLQRKYVEYLKGQGRLDNARKQFDDAIPIYGKHYRFWLRFYEFEMQKSLHINSLQQNSRDGVLWNSSAPFAVAILKQGLEHNELDFPEYLIEALVNHCEDYEDADELQAALLLVQKAQAHLAERRQRESELAAEAAAEPLAEAIVEDRADVVSANLNIGKRKREDDDGTDSAKRSRGDEAAELAVQGIENNHDLKRDREHASILVQHAPDVPETRLRQYFSACGNVKSIKSLHDEDTSFIVEFETADEAKYALSRDKQDLDGNVISVKLNIESTLYITNYPAAADEKFLRALLGPYGEIISIRFPSLQGNKKRRFCYAEMKTSGQAHAALELDGHDTDGLALLVRISNPSAKQQRTERSSDSRTVFVGGIPFKASEDSVRAVFERAGEIQSMKLPSDHLVKGKNKGIAFITYADQHSAQEAVKMDGQEFQGRNIRVTLQEGPRVPKALQLNQNSVSPGPESNGNAGSPVSATAITTSDHEERKQRTIALSDVPDHINEARLRAVAETIGIVRKVILKTNHMGALVEFESAADAGKATLELEGFEISPERKIRVTTQTEMYAQKPEKKVEKIGKHAPPPPSSAAGMVPRRPQQPGAKRGGHLGQRKGAVFKQANGNEKPGGKSNDDFRAMLK